MSSKRVYYGLLGLIGLLLIGLLAGAYGVNNLLVSRANHLTTLKTRSQALTQEQQRFELAQKEVKKYASFEATAKKIVPQDKDQAEAIREIVNISAANGIDLESVTFPPSTLGGNAGSVGSGSTTTSTLPPASSNSKANSAQNKLSQLTAVKGIPGVYQLPITITSSPTQTITYNQLIKFLGALEHNRRTAQVTSISIQQSGGKYVTFTITLNEYIKP